MAHGIHFNPLVFIFQIFDEPSLEMVSGTAMLVPVDRYKGWPCRVMTLAPGLSLESDNRTPQP
jgi:hypothetical protein